MRLYRLCRQLRALPVCVIDGLDIHLWDIRWTPNNISTIVFADFFQDQSDSPAVHGDIVRGNDEDVLGIAGLKQEHTNQHVMAKVKRCADKPVSRPQQLSLPKFSIVMGNIL